MSLAYRASQFFRTLVSRPSIDDRALVQQHLPGTLLVLFYRMSTADQNHSLQVLRTLLAQGERHPDLLAAALLHDVGKTHAPPNVFERIVVVLAGALIPLKAMQWGSSAPTGWRRPFVIAAQHATWGAEIVSNAGGSEALIDLIRYHQGEMPEGSSNKLRVLMRKLQHADGLN